MAQNALLQAVKTRLKANLVSAATGSTLIGLECDTVADGQPPPMAGEEFIGIHENGWDDSPSGDYDLDETYGVLVTLTRRMGQYPLDRVGSELVYKWAAGLGPRLREIVTLLHMNYDVLASANTTLTASVNGFIEPLRSRGAGPVQMKGPDWFYAQSKDKEGYAMCGVARTLRFGGARRIQVISEMG